MNNINVPLKLTLLFKLLITNVTFSFWVHFSLMKNSDMTIQAVHIIEFFSTMITLIVFSFLMRYNVMFSKSSLIGKDFATLCTIHW